jgi:hypothetical protein
MLRKSFSLTIQPQLFGPILKRSQLPKFGQDRIRTSRILEPILSLIQVVYAILCLLSGLRFCVVTFFLNQVLPSRESDVSVQFLSPLEGRNGKGLRQNVHTAHHL